MPQDGPSAARAKALAAVPVATGKTRTEVSNRSEKHCCKVAVHSSPPYPNAVPRLAWISASRICGAARPVLSLRKSIIDLVSALSMSRFLAGYCVRVVRHSEHDRLAAASLAGIGGHV